MSHIPGARLDRVLVAPVDKRQLFKRVRHSIIH